jgi:hypothetical protein
VILLAASVIEIDLERVCSNELIFNTSLRSVPVYMKCISRDASVRKLDVFIFVSQ